MNYGMLNATWQELFAADKFRTCVLGARANVCAEEELRGIGLMQDLFASLIFYNLFHSVPN
jgi:hypothetical protein